MNNIRFRNTAQFALRMLFSIILIWVGSFPETGVYTALCLTLIMVTLETLVGHLQKFFDEKVSLDESFEKAQSSQSLREAIGKINE